MNPLFQLAVPLSAVCTAGRDIGVNYNVEANVFPVNNLPTPSPRLHTYCIHHSDSLHKQTVLNFFEVCSQIECDVESVVPVRQE